MPNTIEQNIERLKATVPAIKNSIITKGGTVNSGDGLEEFADDILSIKNELTDITITSNGKYYSGEETTLTTTTFPATVLDATGTPLKHVDVIGNTNQSGTPSPDNPIMPQGTGDKTANLFDIASTMFAVGYNANLINDDSYVDFTINNNNIEIVNKETSHSAYVLLGFFENGSTLAVTASVTPNVNWGVYATSSTQLPIPFSDTSKFTTIIPRDQNTSKTFTVPQGLNYIWISTGTGSKYTVNISNIMLNPDSTLPYEPFGYKILISCGGTTTNVYLGEVETTRKIRKYEFTGEEVWTKSSRAFYTDIIDNLALPNSLTVCTHFISSPTDGICVTTGNKRLKLFESALPTGITTAAEVQQYMSSQYAVGTPVTIWYVLAEPTTGIVNEPLMKIGEYADELSIDVNIPLEQNAQNIINIDTTLKPSSASFTYNKKGTYIGYNEINVNVPNTYTVEDEGKVVNNATLVSQTAMPTEITVNDTYDTTLYNSITVNVPPPTSTKTDTTGSGIKFIGDGNPLIRCDIEGNMDQQGTPSPSSIIMPDETGDKTANLFDVNNPLIANRYYSTTDNMLINTTNNAFVYIPIEYGKKYYVSGVKRVSSSTSVRWVTTSAPPTEYHTCLRTDVFNQSDVFTLTAESNENYLAIFVCGDSDYSAYGTVTAAITANCADLIVDNGYYLPIECGGTTTPTYLGQVQTTRKIAKYEFTGQETLNGGSVIGQINWITNPKAIKATTICSHYPYKSEYSGTGFPYIWITESSSSGLLWFELPRDYGTDVQDAINKFKQYLADQYANGTPVTVWYVRSTATTGIVNEPIRKIGDYADSVSPTGIPTIAGLNEFRVATTLPPSKTTIEYRYIENIPILDSKTITANGIYNASDDNLDGYSSVNVDVADGSNADVVFYDYDGTVATSYSAADFANLSAMPTNPTRTGLTSQGWNWSLSDAKTYVAAYGKLDIGQMYTTSDGKTRIYINLSEGRISPLMMLYLNANTELDIDWGDNSTHSTWTTTSADYKSERHSYPDKGAYVIVITVVSGSFIFQSQSTSYNTFFTDGNNTSNSSDRAYLNSIQKIEIGTGITTIGDYAFDGCYSLSSISIPDSVTSIGQYAFNNCYTLSSISIPNTATSIQSYVFMNCDSLLSVTIPNTVTSIGDYAFYSCRSLSSINIPNNVTSIGDYAFYSCRSLSSINIPNNVTSIGDNTFSSCYSLSSIIIPNTVTSIGDNTFSSCYSLSSIIIPGNVTAIGSYSFQNCNSMDYIKFIPTTPPTVSNSNAWSGVSTSTIIYVPAESINAYKTATYYPNPSSYKYVGYATYASGDSLPSSIPGYSLTWYATIEDWIAETNPITVGNGNEVYAKTTVVTSITRETDFVNNVTTRSTDGIEALNVYRNINRCNVADDGTINAYYSDVSYTEDGSNGQVMVKIPKFYYKLDVSQTGDLDGVNIRKGRWSIADTKLDNSYKLHPAFLAADGVTELDYFLYGAFDGVGQNSEGIYNTSYNTSSAKLSSVAGSTYVPSNSMTRATARTMAANRGTGWYQAAVKQTMAIQMLFAVEYGFNSQVAVGKGVTNASAATYAGQTTGNITSGTQSNETTPVNWRGIENFWGNIFDWIDGLNINERVPYICDDYTFVDNTSTGYTQISFSLPTTNYITALGYDSTNDWVMLPSESSSTSNPNGPIGDYVHSNAGWRVAQLGGHWANGSNAGAFYWHCNNTSSYASAGIGARLMYIPSAV